MGRTLYLECFSGISGDMTVAALLDLGADRKKLEQALSGLSVQGFRTEITRVKKSGLDACDFHVILDKEHENHDHDMEYLHGKGDVSGQEHHHNKDAVHGHSHEHRGILEIRKIIMESKITDRAKKTAVSVFEILADAEAKAHGVPREQVHFHEVGAIDSIVDIVSAAVCLDDLDITEVIVPKLCEGRGTVRCQHGVLPVPVPAVVNIVEQNGLFLQITEVEGELVTPTGAAVAAAIRTSDHLPDEFIIEKTGIGAGKRQYTCPGILRAMLIREKKTEKKDRIRDQDVIWKLETNIDDTTGENLGYVMDVLLQNGARDVFYTPIYMKKNRPAWLLSVICREEDISRLEGLIFRETTTIGIRRMKMERTVLPREEKTIQTPLGEVQVKVCTYQGETYVYPEYESLVRLCREKGISYKEAMRLVQGCTQTVTD